MATPYRPDLLAPFLALPQGEKVQAECEWNISRPTRAVFFGELGSA